MIHASRELADAIEGVSPIAENGLWRQTHDAVFCTGWRATPRGGAVQAAAIGHGSTSEDTREVDCPSCLVLLREICEPVRWDMWETQSNRVADFPESR